MAERKNFSGDREAAFDYLGAARQALMILKNDMRLGRLLTGMRNITLPDGVYVQVMSVYGQDNISINVPPGTVVETVIKAQIAQARQPDGFVPIDPTVPESGGVFEFKFTDIVPANDRGILSMTRIGSTPARKIFICGGTGSDVMTPSAADSRPVLWTSMFGRRNLSLRTAITRPEIAGRGYKLSADGAWVAGYIVESDPTYPGGARNLKRMCVWKNPQSGNANVIYWVNQPQAHNWSFAYVIDSDGRIRGAAPEVGTVGNLGVHWDGDDRSVPLYNRPSPSDRLPGDGYTYTSADGVVQARNDEYRVNGGPWIKLGINDFVAHDLVSFQEATPEPIVTSISF